MPATVTQLVELMRERGTELPHLKATIAAPLWQGLVAADDSRHGREGGGMGYGYGQTEVTGFCLFGGYGGRGAGNAGRPAPVTSVRILDADGRECAIGEAGEICVRGDTVHLGYWNRPEINAERFRGGWWHTTDLGRRETDGTITFLGTMTRMIKSGAENIFPAEVENCLEAHPAVKEAAVIGIPSERFLQDVKAVVVLNGTATGQRRGAHRALPAPYRLVQEAEDGGVPRRAAAHPAASPRTTRRWTRSSAAGAIRAAATSAAAIDGRRVAGQHVKLAAQGHRLRRLAQPDPRSPGKMRRADDVRRFGQHRGEFAGFFRGQPDQPVAAAGVHRDLDRG